MARPRKAAPGHRIVIPPVGDAAEYIRGTPAVGEAVLYCIRSDDGVLVWRKAEVIAAENGVCLCVTLIPREPAAAAARITRPQGWALHGYVLEALEGDTVGRYTRKP